MNKGKRAARDKLMQAQEIASRSKSRGKMFTKKRKYDQFAPGAHKETFQQVSGKKFLNIDKEKANILE